MKTAKALRGFKRTIVPDCPYCHREHEHSEEVDGPKQADCGLGEYVLDFSQGLDKPTDKEPEI
jgi:hypothetical protein